MRTGRPKEALILTEEERARLESMAHRARSQPLLARRARVVLACGGGLDSLPPGRRRTSAHAARRARPERHNPRSIATLRIVLARLLLRHLPHCPFCGSRSG